MSQSQSQARLHRQAVAADAEAMAALHKQCFDPFWEAWVMQGFAESANAICLAEERDGALAGFVIAQVAADEAELITIAVDPEQRRQGIARAMLQAIFTAAKQRGAACLFFDVDANNDAARLLYEGLGAVPVGRRVGYYTNGADAVILRIDL